MPTFLVAQPLSFDSLSLVQDLCLSCSVVPSLRPGYGCYIQSYSSPRKDPEFVVATEPIQAYVTDVFWHPNGLLSLCLESKTLERRTVERDLSQVFKDLQDEVIIAPQATAYGVAKLTELVRRKPFLITLLQETLLETVS